MRRPTYAAAVTGALSLVLLAPLSLGTPATADPESLPAPALENRAVQAEQALDRVQDLLGGQPTPEGRGDGPQASPGAGTEEGREVTLALRDLDVAEDDLGAGDRQAAEGYRARPTDGSGAPFGVKYDRREARPTCGTDVCVHRVGSGSDKSTRAYARTTLRTLQSVHQKYVGAGYRGPKSDRAARNNGGNGKTDVYLADIGDRGIYGYCTTDQPRASDQRSVWAYCVLDNDYRTGQFPTNTPRANLRVTAAHEYFHAVQFGYDYLEDSWLIEGTATWAEDELYDGVDDNVNYLVDGPMGRPGRSLDLDSGGLEVYGVWSFFRYLTEQLPASSNGLPTLVRETWERADAAGTAPDEYSLQALERVLAERDVEIRDAFADYVAGNRFPGRTYEEGAENRYPVAPLTAQARLSSGSPTATVERRINHLAGGTVRLVPARGLTSADQEVEVRVTVPRFARGSEVRITVARTDGTQEVTDVEPDANGVQTVRRAFTAGDVAGVEVHLVNASTRIDDCFLSDSAISCEGYALDDRLPFAVDARLARR